MKKDHTQRTQNTNTWIQWMIQLLRGSLLAVIITPICLLIGAYCISNGLLQTSQLSGIVYGSCVIGSICGGVFAIGQQGTRSIPLGLGVGMILFLLCLAGGTLYHGSSLFTGGGLGHLLSCLCGGAMAGILCRKRQKKAR